MNKVLRIGTRDSQLAVWQATQVQQLLQQNHFSSELVFIKSEGDLDLQTPLYEMGVQGIFTKSLDIALLNNRIDIAVHSMKDVPTQLAKGIVQAAVLKRGSYKDLFVMNGEWPTTGKEAVKFGKPFTMQHPKAIGSAFIVATSSTRRKAQWLNRYPDHNLENLRGNVNTRLKKLEDSNWNGAIFAAAGLERINLRPENSVDLDWMLPAPAQGAIMVVCREDDDYSFTACKKFDDVETALCTKIERDFLRTLLGGCSTPISALAEIKNKKVIFKGNVLSVDGKDKIEVEESTEVVDALEIGAKAGKRILESGGQKIIEGIHAAKQH